ncbi:MAG: hypothetical protein FXV80_02985 [Candidatus Thioglobus sp.]|nr:MAG: hypothetical protein FXV80_02985 [Candidatus Thioglobus sp.]
MNQLPINKILVAGFAFAITHWRRILQISIVPLILSLPFFLIVPEMLDIMKKLLLQEEFIMPNNMVTNMVIYSLLFLYACISLSISIFRLVLGTESVGIMPIIEPLKIGKFIALALFIGALSLIAVFSGLWIILPLLSFLLAPIMLNFVNIAIEKPIKYRWNLPFVTHLNLFFLQVIVPELVVFLFYSLFSIIDLGENASLAAKVIMFYWSAITLPLCYHLITTAKQNP